MNKVYKSVFSIHTGTYVAVSELMRQKGKSSVSKTSLAGLVVAGTVVGWVGSTDAQTIVGLSPTATGGVQYVPLGSTNHLNGIAIGGGTPGTSVSGVGNMALGESAGRNVTGNANVALGSLAQQTVSGDNNVAIGTSAGNSVMTSNTVSIGTRARASMAGAVALGLNATASAQAGDVALGSGSVTSPVVATLTGTFGGQMYAFAGTNPSSTVSVGGAGVYRTITNVAAGRVSNSSTDAVNGSQLYAVSQAVDASKTHYYSVNEGGYRDLNYNNEGATGIQAMAAGVGTKAVGFRETSIGSFAGVGGLAGNIENVSVGSMTGQSVSGSHNLALGTASGSSVSGYANVGVGSTAGRLVSGAEHIAIGMVSGNTVSGQANIGIGSYAGNRVQGTGNVGIGYSAGENVSGYWNSAFGSHSGVRVTGHNNTAVGEGAGRLVSGGSNVAMGLSAGNGVTGYRNIALGEWSGDSVVADETISMGYRALASKANAVAMGSFATANQVGAVAIGDRSAATAQAHDVALGWTSQTALVVNTTSAVVGPLTYGGFAGTAATSTVSIGNVGTERTLTNVAAGRITETSTDAINGSQLYAVAARAAAYDLNPDGTVNYTSLTFNPGGASTSLHNVAAGIELTDAVNVSQLNTTVNAARTRYYSVNDGGTEGGNYNNDGATAVGAIASGVGTSATALNASAFGSGAVATTINSVALGAGSTTAAVNTGATAFYGGTAAGLASTANGTVSVGSAGAERQIQNVAAGVISATSTDAINGSQLYSVTTGVNQLGTTTASALGGGSTYDINSGAISAPTYAVIGTSVNNVGAAITNILTMSPVQYVDATGTTTPYTPSNEVTLVGAAANMPVTLHNVAAGVAPTDAVNVSQLTSIINTNKTKYYGVASTGGGNEYGEGATGTDAIASGKDALASAGNAVAIGLGATASTTNSIALGAGSITSDVHTGTTSLYGMTAAGLGSNTFGTVSLGTSTAPRQVQNVAAGVLSGTSTDAVNGSQLYAVSTGVNNLGSSAASALGGGSTYNTASGTLSAPTYQVIGTSVTQVGAAITNVITQGPVQYSNAEGVAQPYTPSNHVTLVGATPGAVTLHNVAPGVAPTDAVNVSQLTATNQYVAYVDNRVTQVDARVTQVDNRVTVLDSQNVKYDLLPDGANNYNSVTLGGGKSDGPVSLHNVADGVQSNDAVNKGQLDGLGKKMYGSIAASASLEGAPYIPGKLTSAAGIASIGGETALGVSLRKTADNARWSVSGGIAYSPSMSKGPLVRAVITNIWD
jgi:autotransporter adhesin